METEEIKDQFEQILSDLKVIKDLPSESAILVAQVILQEAGKDRRALFYGIQKLSNSGYNSSIQNNENSADQPATPKQKNALMRFGIKFNNDITKSEASELLDDAFAGR